jgi:signal transduction histidine kinase
MSPKGWLMTEMNLTLESNRQAPRISREKLSEIRSEIEPRFDDLALVVSELVSNSVRHSGRKTVSVSIKKTANLVRLEVRDPGPGFDPDHTESDGMGLRIVSRVADAWGIDNDGACTVWVEVALPVGI